MYYFFNVTIGIPSEQSVSTVRDWSLITGRGGGLHNGRGACEVLPLEKGGGGHKQFWGRFYTVAWRFKHIEGETQKVSTLNKGGMRKALPCLQRGGGRGRKKFQTRDFPI